MADSGQKSEKPTQGRLKKAREEGRFASSRDLIAAAHFVVALAIAVTIGAEAALDVERMAVLLLRRAFDPAALTPSDVVRVFRFILFNPLLLLLKQGALLLLITLLVQLVTTGFGFSIKQLLPSFEKLNTLNRLRQLPQQNLFSAGKALLLLPVIGAVLYAEIYHQLPMLANLAAAPLMAGLAEATDMVRSLFWRLSLALLLLGFFDFARQRQRFQSELRMTKQEVRDELKESEGNPQMKFRIRRLQRDAARRSMLKAVPKATAVIVNPTHYAIALHYAMNSKAVPSVVAKGKNYLAHLIRQKAAEHDVPVIENQPLAQALYQAVEVGQEIPPHLYRAVAEVLAYIYRTLSRR
ncbi:MAG: EscU/YscU/HrcU family type III secretion system export apparatus switch protein [Acidobacteriaceae bacterium]|nr:EscU/YscU/HrcU family type III secretion system export apparatus switch protein [Acidobacteriaceae bacterium]